MWIRPMYVIFWQTNRFNICTPTTLCLLRNLTAVVVIGSQIWQCHWKNKGTTSTLSLKIYFLCWSGGRIIKWLQTKLRLAEWSIWVLRFSIYIVWRTWITSRTRSWGTFLAFSLKVKCYASFPDWIFSLWIFKAVFNSADLY